MKNTLPKLFLFTFLLFATPNYIEAIAKIPIEPAKTQKINSFKNGKKAQLKKIRKRLKKSNRALSSCILGLMGMILTGLAIVFWISQFFFFGFIISCIGIILGIPARKKEPQRKTLAWIGIISGILGASVLILYVLAYLIAITLANA